MCRDHIQIVNANMDKAEEKQKTLIELLKELGR